MPRIYRPNEVVPINPGGLLGIQIPGAPPGIICDGRPIAWDADPPTKTNKDTSSLECGFEWQTFSRTSRELERDALIFFLAPEASGRKGRAALFHHMVNECLFRCPEEKGTINQLSKKEDWMRIQ